VTKVDLVVDPVTRGVLTKGANNLVVVNDGVIRDPSGNPIPLPVGVSALAKDPAMDALVQSYVNRTGPISNQVIGNVAGPLTRTANAAGESQMGDLVADIYMRASTGPTFGAGAAQFAVTNPGGIRANLAGGPVTFGALFSVIPFGNYLVTMDLTGAQIRRLLEQQWEAPQPAGGRVLQVSSEFTYTWDANQPAGAAPGTGQRVVANSMKLNGVTLVPAQTYRVTVNNFIASGGDNFTVLTQGAAAQSGAVDIDAGFAYFRVLVNVPAPAQNRIARIN
jgi:5'-nucleotidase